MEVFWSCIVWIDNTVSDIFWIWNVLIFIWFTLHWINIFVVKHIILKFHGQIKPSPFENCYSIAVTVLNPSFELEIDKSISEGNECLISKMLLFHNWRLHGRTLIYLEPCFDITCCPSRPVMEVGPFHFKLSFRL